MKIEHSFTIEAPYAQAWAGLTDISVISSCLPGVTMTEEADGRYLGSVKSRVGPVTAEYRSSAHFVERDEASGRLVLDATGRDSRTDGNVRMLVTAKVTGAGDQTRVKMNTEVSGTGKVAQLGRGAIQPVSEKLLAQFVTCMNANFTATHSVPQADGVEPNVSTNASASGDHDALDLLDAAGREVAKRVVPVAVVVLVIVALLLYLL